MLTTSRTLPFALPVLLALVSSPVAPPEAQAQVETRDSAGIAIVESAPQQARAPSRLTISAEPVLQIGELDGPPPYLFSSISGLAMLEGNRILVVDEGSSELRFFDLAGEFLGQWGGSGQGPGEFREPRLTNMLPGDSVAIFDRGNRRFTVYPADSEEGFRTFPATWPGSAQATSGSIVLLASGSRLPPMNPDGPYDIPTQLRLIDVQAQTEQLVATMPRRFVPVSRGGLPIHTEPPYSFVAAMTASHDGFVVADPAGPALHEYRWDGGLGRIIRLQEPPREVTVEEFREAVDQRAERVREQSGPAAEQAYRDAYRSVEPPSVRPTFQEVVVDDAGWIWAQLYSDPVSEPSNDWLVFDPDGRGQGSVELPVDLSVRAVSTDYVLGLWQDEFEVEYVAVYRIERP